MSDIFKDYSFGGWLKSFRLKRKLGLREMCEASGLDASNYCNIEQSRIAPPNTKEKIDKLTEPLKLSGTERALLYTAAVSWHKGKVIDKFWGLKDE